MKKPKRLKLLMNDQQNEWCKPGGVFGTPAFTARADVFGPYKRKHEKRKSEFLKNIRASVGLAYLAYIVVSLAAAIVLSLDLFVWRK